MNDLKSNNKVRLLKSLRVVALILSPVLCFIFIRTEWIARLTAVTGSMIIGSCVMFYYGCHPKTNFSWTDPKVGQERSWKIKETILRILVLGFAFLYVYMVTIPVIREGCEVAEHGSSYLLEIDGEVLDNNTFVGMFFIHQSLSVSYEKNDRRHLSAYFFPRVAKYGKVYHFLILPKSGMVLDWK